MNKIEKKCKELLKKQGISISSEINFDVNGKIHTLSFEYIVDTFMIASDESKMIFLTALKKAVLAQDIGVNEFFESMGKLLLMAHLSNKIEI
ncbi:MAG: hypothetical protein L3J10_04170 [Sulfurimonas sp.]|nr:hypothetical protein [Sulfurimonas sp.]